MSQQLQSTTTYNHNELLSVAYQNGGTARFSTRNLIGKIVESVRDSSCLGICKWQRFIGRRWASICIIKFYRPVPPTAGRGPGSVYAQQTTHFSNLRRRELPITNFLPDLDDDIKTWKTKGYQIILIGGINEYILSKK